MKPSSQSPVPVAPRKPIEVTITANGFDWEEVIAALDERVERLTRNRELGAGCYADGSGASHTADVQLRDVTREQFVDESIAWLDAQKTKSDPTHVRESIRTYAGAHALHTYDTEMAELAALRHRFETERPLVSVGPVTGDRLLASLACHIDHDEPPGMAARGLAKSALELLGGLSSFQVVMLSGHLRELAQKFKPCAPGEGTST